MNKEINYHVPILLNECVNALINNTSGIFVDCTLGGGGHTRKILKEIDSQSRLISIDKDIDAINHSLMLKNEYTNFTLIKNDYNNIHTILNDLNINKVDGFLLDLGVSSFQLDNEDRGFSYHFNSFLDMRMDQSSELTAYHIVNTYSEEELAKLILDYSDEKFAKNIAKNIVKVRTTKEIRTSFDLVDIIDKSIPAKIRYAIKGHPAKRTFQALRIAVNNEINPLENTIKEMINRLNNHGRIVILSFHSIEDRIIKNVFKTAINPCTCPPKSPICICGNKPLGKLINRKPIIPSQEEQNINSRAHSAKLRIFERIYNE